MKWEKLIIQKRLKETESVVYNDEFIMYSDKFVADLKRISESELFRILSNKTQIYSINRNPRTRTRLTHSMEVAIIVEILATNLGRFAFNELRFIDQSFFVNQQDFTAQITHVLKAAAFIHDIANPPLGHATEKSVSDFYLHPPKEYAHIIEKIAHTKYYDSLIKYDGNANNLRFLTNILGMYATTNGLNLCAPILDTIIKYPYSPSEAVKNQTKAGYYYLETANYHLIKEITGTKLEDNFARHPLTFLLEAADDIAYLTSDVIDACEMNVLSTNSKLLLNLEKYLKSKKNNFDEEHIIPNIKLDYSSYISKRKAEYAKNFIIREMCQYAFETFKLNYEDIMNGNAKKLSLMDGFENEYLGYNDFKTTSAKEIYTQQAKIQEKEDFYIKFILRFLFDNILIHDNIKTVIEAFSIDSSVQIILFYENISKNELDEDKLLYYKLSLIQDLITNLTDFQLYNIFNKL